MSDVLITLPLGVVLMVVAFWSLHRFSRLGAKAAAGLVSFVAVGAYTIMAAVARPGVDVIAVHLTGYLVTAYILGFLGTHRERLSRAGTGAPRLHWGPVAIMVFFAVILLANAILVSVSRQGLPDWIGRHVMPHPNGEGPVHSAFPGVVSHDLQQKEVQYNAYLERMERQRLRGWQVHKGWLGTPSAGEAAVFQVAVRDRDGDPVQHAVVSGEFLRPSDSRLDQVIALEEREPGVYRATVVLPDPGVWDLHLVIRRGDDVHELRATTTVDRGSK